MIKYRYDHQFIYVNVIFDNSKSINIMGSIKNNKTDNWEKINLTIWKTKSNGEQTIAFEKYIKECIEPRKVKCIEAYITSANEFNGVQQAWVNKITEVRLLTDKELIEKEDRKQKYAKEQNKELKPASEEIELPSNDISITAPKEEQTEEVKDLTDGVPWDLDL